jgi:hypothetical protein
VTDARGSHKREVVKPRKLDLDVSRKSIPIIDASSIETEPSKQRRPHGMSKLP